MNDERKMETNMRMPQDIRRRPCNNNRPQRPPVNHRPPHNRDRHVYAVFVTRLSAEIFERRLRVVGISGEVAPFNRARLWGNPFGVRIDKRDQFLARRVLNNNLAVDFIGWF
ncbi:MAG: hypothetical protein FWF56_00840 [Firmicutes bacterium]|nr:hypothetical protein [Bacillota bacterium]MCL1953444.1 hypothetical protein [Bacillota bacterium]